MQPSHPNANGHRSETGSGCARTAQSSWITTDTGNLLLTWVGRFSSPGWIRVGKLPGGLPGSQGEAENLAAECNLRGFLETNTKENLGCEELKQAILADNNCEGIPFRTTEVLFIRPNAEGLC